jgi:tRNA (pseudouridine54-N1)-methyltransferase
MRRFVVVGRMAHASAGLLLDDIPGTSGRVDVLLRCVRAALLVSHGLRRDVVVYLVLGGDASGSRAVRIDGARAQFLRPDERSLALTVKKSLERSLPVGSAFDDVRPGIAVAAGGLEAVLADLPIAPAYALDETGTDIRQENFDPRDVTLFVGDHLGFDDATRGRLGGLGVRSLSVGPTSLHAEDAIAVASNEMDRRCAPHATDQRA